MRIEISQPGDTDNTTGEFEVQVDGTVQGTFWVYAAAEQFADFLATDLPSPFSALAELTADEDDYEPVHVLAHHTTTHGHVTVTSVDGVLSVFVLHYCDMSYGQQHFDDEAYALEYARNVAAELLLLV